MERYFNFKPVVYLSKDERYMPVPVEVYIANSVMTDTVINVNPELYYGQGINTPFYLQIDKKNPDMTRLVWWFYYAYSGPLKVCCFDAGAHQSDFEHVSMYLNKEETSIVRMYFSAHGNKDGLWVDKEHIEFEKDGDISRPVVYSANSTHGCYPEGRTYWRYFGVLNDHTDKGIRWDPLIQVIDENTEWNKYAGAIGYPDHGRMPLYKSAWVEEPSVSTNDFRRFIGY